MWVPSVTTVLDVLAKPQLEQYLRRRAVKNAVRALWVQHSTTLAGMSETDLEQLIADNLGDWLGQEQNEQAAIGTHTHDLIQHMLLGQDWRQHQSATDLLARDLTDVYGSWYGASVEVPLAVESAITGELSGLRFAGRLDHLVELKAHAIIGQTEQRTKYAPIAGLTALVDVKTSAGFYPEHGAQLAAYAVGVEQTYGVRPDLLLSVRLDKESIRYYVRAWEYEPSLRLFQAALNLWYARKGVLPKEAS